MKRLIIAMLALLLIMSAADALPRTGGAQGIRVANLYVDGNTVVTGTLTAGASSETGNIGADQTWAANKDIKAAAGTGEFDWSPATGTFKTTTGINTFGGDMLMSGAKAFTSGTGAFTIKGAMSTADVASVKDLLSNGTINTGTFTSTGTAKIGTTLTAKDMLINDTISTEKITASGTAKVAGVATVKDLLVNDTISAETFASTGTAKVGTTLTAKDMLINDTASFETVTTSGTAKFGGATTGASVVSNTTVSAAADGFLANSVILPQEIAINWEIDANSANGTIFIADDNWQVTSIEEVHSSVATYGGVVAAVVVRCNSTETPATGMAMTSNTFNLKATAETVQTGTLKTPANGAIKLNDGNRMAILFNDPLTGLAGGCVTIHLKRLAAS